MILCDCLRWFVELNILSIIAVYNTLKLPIYFITWVYKILGCYLNYIHSGGKHFLSQIASEKFFWYIIEGCLSFEHFTNVLICAACLLFCYICSVYLAEREHKMYNGLIEEMKSIKTSLETENDLKVLNRCLNYLRHANNHSNFLLYSAQRKYILRQCKSKSRIDWEKHHQGITCPVIKPKSLYSTSVSAFDLLSYKNTVKNEPKTFSTKSDSGYASGSTWQGSDSSGSLSMQTNLSGSSCFQQGSNKSLISISDKFSTGSCDIIPPYKNKCRVQFSNK